MVEQCGTYDLVEYTVSLAVSCGPYVLVGYMLFLVETCGSYDEELKLYIVFLGEKNGSYDEELALHRAFLVETCVSYDEKVLKVVNILELEEHKMWTLMDVECCILLEERMLSTYGEEQEFLCARSLSHCRQVWPCWREGAGRR